MTLTDEEQDELNHANSFVAWNVGLHFWTRGEWPTPEEVWHSINDQGWLGVSPISLEEARLLCIQACDTGDVYGIPTIVAMRHGEVHGDWLAPLGDENPWRLAVGAETFKDLGESPHFARAVDITLRKVA